MKKKLVTKKVTAIFGVGLMLSTPFQSYAFASGVSKLTSSVYRSTEGQASASQALGSLNIAKGVFGFIGSSASAQDSQGNSKTVSDAYNFKDLSQTVDPRTGVFSISYKVAEVVGNGFEDPAVSLSIHYSSLSNSNGFGLGKGWGWNLTHYDPQSGMLSLSSGGSYKLDEGKGKLKYYKLNDLKVTVGSAYITLKYKDGRVEQVDRTFGNLIKLTNVQGYSAEFKYTQGNRLESISYQNPLNGKMLKKLEVLYPSDSTVLIKRNDGTEHWPVTVLMKGKSGSVLEGIQDPLNQKIQFSYKAEEEKLFSTDSLITDVIYPTGTTIQVTYLAGGLAAAKEGLASPAVSKIKTISLPKTESNEEEIRYSYYENSNSNYLGRGFSGFKEGEDTLFFTPNDYTYSTVESRPAPDHQTISTERVYNHFHQQIKENVRLNGTPLQSKEFTYPEWTSKKFESLDANYNFPVETKTIYYNGGNSRVEITKQQYDNSGNILKAVDPSGLVKEFKYMPSEKTFNGIVHLPEREMVRSTSGGMSKITDYVYEEAKNAQGIPFQRLKAKVYKFSKGTCAVSDSGCGTVYKTEIHSYADNN